MSLAEFANLATLIESHHQNAIEFRTLPCGLIEPISMVRNSYVADDCRFSLSGSPLSVIHTAVRMAKLAVETAVIL